ncbi:hypothetical protein OAM12_00760 [Candidatus Pelagibacter sp.]|nr:hypothetical protein [Candidatus Pelagibacter sp.]
MLKQKINLGNKKQIKILNKVTNSAIRKIEQENKNKDRDLIEEWFRYVELVGQDLKRYLN